MCIDCLLYVILVSYTGRASTCIVFGSLPLNISINSCIRTYCLKSFFQCRGIYLLGRIFVGYILSNGRRSFLVAHIILCGASAILCCRH